MKRTELLESATAPDGTSLTLHRHDGAYYLKANGGELMTTRRHASEDRLAEVVCVPLAERNAAAPAVLIGGLGLGFTLRAALRCLPADALVVVAEIVPEVVRWNQNAEYKLSHEALLDGRVSVYDGDVLDVIQTSRGKFDGIMLDIDNGAEAMTTAENAELYRVAGIHSVVAALRPGGLVAYWSAVVDHEFERALQTAGLEVSAVRVRAHDTTGPLHSIFVCRIPTRAESRGAMSGPVTAS
ncbi:MAG: hypothetical protein ABI442_01305 [Gemmatimonadaceae bacterium]